MPGRLAVLPLLMGALLPFPAFSAGAGRAGAMPPTRNDYTIQGAILEVTPKTGGQLNIAPADMTIYVYRFRVGMPGDSALAAEETVILHAKVKPPKNWQDRVLRARIASYAGGASYWLVGFVEEEAGQAPDGGETGR